jgi:hypothetical protein
MQDDARKEAGKQSNTRDAKQGERERELPQKEDVGSR